MRLKMGNFFRSWESRGSRGFNPPDLQSPRDPKKPLAKISSFNTITHIFEINDAVGKSQGS